MAEKPNYVVAKDKLRRLSKFEQLAKEKALAADQHGQSAMMQELTAMEYRFVRDDTEGVKSYVGAMVATIRDHQGGIAELLNVIPLIQEIATVARKNDLSLAPKEKDRIDKAASELVAFVRRHTTLGKRMGARISSAVVNVARKRRENMAASMVGSESALFRLVGRLITPKMSDPKPDTEKALKDIRASVYRTTVERRDDFMARDEDTDDLFSPKRFGGGRRGRQTTFTGDEDLFGLPSTPPRGKTKGKTNTSGPVADTTTHTYLQGMHSELQAIHSILDTMAEDLVQDEERDYRDADNTSERMLFGQPDPRFARPDKADKSGGLFGGLARLLGGGGGLLSLLGGSNGFAGTLLRLVPRLGIMAKGAGIVGAAMLGWKIGEQIDKWTNASEHVGNLASRLWDWMTGDGAERERQKKDLEKKLIEDKIRRGMPREYVGKPDMIAMWDEQVRTGALKPDASGKMVMNPKADAVLASFAKGETPDLGTGTWAKNLPPPPAGKARMPERSDYFQMPTRETKAPTSTQSPVQVPPTAPPATAPSSPVRRVSAGDFNYEVYRETVGKRESRGNYRAENRFGYLGKYQMGAQALITAGLLKRGTPQSKAAIDNPKNWKLAGGKEAFLADAALQDRVMQQYTYRNLARLKQLKLVSNESTADVIAGNLMAAHLIGPDGLKKQGMSGADANGTRAAEYYALASAAQMQTVPVNVRSASPVTSATLTQQSRGNTVVAPVVNQNNNAPAQTPVVVPMPMRTENGEVTLRAIRSAGLF